MQLPIRQLDAFASAPFEGNPAAVCPLETWLPTAWMQAIAAENNLSETAFLVPAAGAWELRWFTPRVEIDLCGHATLAAGWVVLNELDPGAEAARFQTRSGALVVERAGSELSLDLPASPPGPLPDRFPGGVLDAAYLAALGARPREALAGANTLCVFEREAEVRALAPDMRSLARAEPRAVICTAPADDPQLDFVSRFFAPAKGVAEDPVTGSAHCTLTPYWSARLGKRELAARQLSERGGSLRCHDEGARVRLFGQVIPYLSGTIEVPDPGPA